MTVQGKCWKRQQLTKVFEEEAIKKEKKVVIQCGCFFFFLPNLISKLAVGDSMCVFVHLCTRMCFLMGSMSDAPKNLHTCRFGNETHPLLA